MFLKEGWDNPNVFQICTLNETNSVMKKRQEIGRGLRICVNQDGERVRGLDVNTLTIMANESYEEFASSLQREMEEDERIRFERIEKYVKDANKKVMASFIVDGIKYHRIGDEVYYAQECFENEELFGYLKSNMIKNRDYKAIYSHTVYDSEVEENFAKKFNESSDVKLFTKLPSWFKINTPLGGYNPDWAVLIERDNEEKLYFVVESKGSELALDLRDSESAKIQCAKEHFKAISDDVQMIQAKEFNSLRDNI